MLQVNLDCAVVTCRLFSFGRRITPLTRSSAPAAMPGQPHVGLLFR